MGNKNGKKKMRENEKWTQGTTIAIANQYVRPGLHLGE